MKGGLYKMVITTISLTNEEKTLISEFGLSPTALIKEKLAEFYIIRARNNSEVSDLTEKIRILQSIIERFNKFIRINQLDEAWISFPLK
jgi:hypothetical protein